jgi:hypothetical protein
VSSETRQTCQRTPPPVRAKWKSRSATSLFSWPVRSWLSYGSCRDPLFDTNGMHIAITKETEIFKRIVECGRKPQLSADWELVEGAPVTALIPRIQPHGAAGEIPEFALDFVRWVRQTSVVQGARRSRCLLDALGGIKNAVRKRGPDGRTVYRSCQGRLRGWVLPVSRPVRAWKLAVDCPKGAPWLKVRDLRTLRWDLLAVQTSDHAPG